MVNPYSLPRYQRLITNLRRGKARAAGVYFLWNQYGELLYIGQSTNLRKRLYGHFSTFSYVLMPSEMLRTFEALMIVEYTPPLNRQDYVSFKGSGTGLPEPNYIDLCPDYY